MKKLLSFLFIATVFLLFPISISAQSLTPVSYSKPVSVSLTSGQSISFGIDGIYELRNNSTNERTYVNPGVSLSATRNGSNVVIQIQGRSYTSASGFTLQEVSGPARVSTFSSETHMRRGAQSNYSIVATFYPGQAVIFLDSFQNSQGETWFNVMDSRGQRGWVPAQTTFAAKDTPSLSLTSVNSRKYRGSLDIQTSSSGLVLLNRLDMENYLKGVVPAEMPASWHMEALKAQAISARSFAANSMSLSNTTASQVYHGYTGEHPRTSEAVDATRNKVVTHNGQPIQTFFFSTSGGRTANIGDVWNSNQSQFPYLVSVADSFEDSPHSNWTETYRSRVLLNQFGFSSSAILQDIQLSKTGANGEVGGVTLITSEGNKTITGNENQIRRIFPIEGRSYTFLRSNWFDINATKQYTIRTQSQDQQQFSVAGQRVQTNNGTSTISGNSVTVQTVNGTQTMDTDPASIHVNGKGFGHRIGMSQYGAKGFAENGRTAEQILLHFYPGTKVETR